jgi:coenzyme PQQ synthesis protein D (PqqD)
VPDHYPEQNPKAAWRAYDGEAVIVSPEDSTLHTLNAVGTVIWEAADGRTGMEAIVARVCDAFEVDRATAARDTAAFVDSLAQRGLLTVLDAPRPAA